MKHLFKSLVLVLLMPFFLFTSTTALAGSTCDGKWVEHTDFQLRGAHYQSKCTCQSCHQGNFTKGSAPTVCENCHVASGRGGAMPKGTSHIPTALGCASCHTDNALDFMFATFTHQGVTPGTCNTCHNGNFTSSNAQGKNAGHIPTSDSCDTCHKNGYADWGGAHFDHVGVIPGTCNQCHTIGTGGAVQMPSNHIPTNSASCDSCHKGSYATFANGQLHKNVVVDNNCEACHSGTSLGAEGKSPTHTGTAQKCIACHSPTGWPCTGASLEMWWKAAVKQAMLSIEKWIA